MMVKDVLRKCYIEIHLDKEIKLEWVVILYPFLLINIMILVINLYNKQRIKYILNRNGINSYIKFQ